MIKIKTKEDIAILREGGRRHGVILRELAKMVRPGLKTQELENRARVLIEQDGDKAPFLNFRPSGAGSPFPAALCVSVNDEIVHGIPNEDEKILKDGDVVTLDLGLTHKGLITDAAITVAVGTVTPEVQHLIEITKKSLNVAIKVAKGGKRVGDIGEAIERTCIAEGITPIEELAGHGVGYSVHEDPFIPNYGIAGKGIVLQPGMVITIEPSCTIGEGGIIQDRNGHTYKTVDGSPSAHFEHTILITKGDAEVLTA